MLDLTPHPRGVPHLSECAWVARRRPPGSSVDRYVVVGLVIGNPAHPERVLQAGEPASPRLNEPAVLNAMCDTDKHDDAMEFRW